MKRNVLILFIHDIEYFRLKSMTEVFPKIVKGALSSLRQFLTAESPLKMMKNAFYITSKALFVLKIFKFLS